MAAAIVGVNAEGIKGQAIVPTGTGFANTTAFTVTVSGPSTSQNDIKVTGTSSGGGAIDPKLTITLNAPGPVTVHIVCGSDDISETTDIWNAG